jgi:hypothetical protein
MKTIEKCAFQGDVMFRRVDSLPSGLRRVEPAPEGLIVAHSETGHHHLVDPTQAALFAGDDPMVCYLQVSDYCDVNHARPWDTHETLRLIGGGGSTEKAAVWKVVRQREWAPEGWRRVED